MNDRWIHAVKAQAEIVMPETEDFERLFAGQWPRLIRILQRMTGNRNQAEDIVQETFLRFHDRKSGIRNPAAWLYSVAFVTPLLDSTPAGSELTGKELFLAREKLGRRIAQEARRTSMVSGLENV